MKEEFLAELVTKLTEYASSTEIFLKGEAPKYITELLNFKFVECLTELYHPFTALIFVTICITVVRYLFVSARNKNPKDRDGYYITATVAMIIAFICLNVAIISTKDILIEAYKIKYAPRIYIVEYLASLKK